MGIEPKLLQHVDSLTRHGPGWTNPTRHHQFICLVVALRFQAISTARMRTWNNGNCEPSCTHFIDPIIIIYFDIAKGRVHACNLSLGWSRLIRETLSDMFENRCNSRMTQRDAEATFLDSSWSQYIIWLMLFPKAENG